MLGAKSHTRYHKDKKLQNKTKHRTSQTLILKKRLFDLSDA